jgi:transcriptional regulator with XRE-family HTH domain
MATIGSDLQALREERGWSRQRLSEELGGFSTSYLHYVEHDEVLPSAEKLTEIVKALGGDPAQFVRRRNELELERLGHDARTTVLFEEKFGRLTGEEREAAERAVERVRRSKKKARSNG